MNGLVGTMEDRKGHLCGTSSPDCVTYFNCIAQLPDDGSAYVLKAKQQYSDRAILCDGGVSDTCMADMESASCEV
jgi:hypothetical protein